MPAERDESFSREHRLRKADDFKRVFSRGKRTVTPYFVIYALPNHLPFSRLGIQVRSRVGNAVCRNYLKRIVREVFRKRKKEFREPLDLIVIPEKKMTQLNYHRFAELFDEVMKKYLQ